METCDNCTHYWLFCDSVPYGEGSVGKTYRMCRWGYESEKECAEDNEFHFGPVGRFDTIRESLYDCDLENL
jgi:hypothetical protein